MFASFDTAAFLEAIDDKNYLYLKVCTVNAILNDPTFDRSELKEVLDKLDAEVPEIFEEEITLGYEERLPENEWDKAYFSKLTYWFQRNFAKSRLEYIKAVGKVVHADTAKEYAKSMSIGQTSKQQNSTVKNPTLHQGKRNLLLPIAVIGAIVLLVVILAIK